MNRSMRRFLIKRLAIFIIATGIISAHMIDRQTVNFTDPTPPTVIPATPLQGWGAGNCEDDEYRLPATGECIHSDDTKGLPL